MRWRRPVLIVCVSVTELSWLYPWLAILGRAGTGYMRLLRAEIAFGQFFLALLVAALMSRWRIAERYQRIVVGGLILLTALLTIYLRAYGHVSILELRWIGKALANLVRVDRGISRELFLTLATFVLWWRGLSMNREMLITDVVGFRFRLGILLLIGMLIVQALTYHQDMTGWVLSLFLCGLVSIALARIKEGVASRQDSGRFNLRWLLMLLGGACGTLLLGLLLSSVFSNDAAIWQGLWSVLTVVGIVLFSIIFVISYAVVSLILAVLPSLLPSTPQMDTVVTSPLQLPEEWMQYQGGSVPKWFDLVQQGVIVLIVVGIFALLLVGVRRWRLRPSDGPDVWRESAWSTRDLGSGLLAGLRGNLRRLAGQWGREARRAYSAATIRNIYASLLMLADRRGVQRPPPRTPFEYLPTLRQAFPGWGPELQQLTAAYVKAHYGQSPDTEEELQSLRDAWQRIRSWAETHPEG